VLKLAPRAAELADDLRPIVPLGSPSDEPAVRLLALVLARIEAASLWLAEVGLTRLDGEPQPILARLERWENGAVRLLDRLGMTPAARAALGVDVARASAEIERLDSFSRMGASLLDGRLGEGDGE